MNILDQIRAYLAEQNAQADMQMRDPKERAKTLELVKNLAMGASMAGPATVGKEAITTLATPQTVNTIANVGGRTVAETARQMLEDTISRVLTNGYGQWKK